MDITLSTLVWMKPLNFTHMSTCHGFWSSCVPKLFRYMVEDMSEFLITGIGCMVAAVSRGRERDE